jgi:hypothetical protein
MNKSEAVDFVRKSGTFAGLSILLKRHAPKIEDEKVTSFERNRVTSDIDVIVLRTGSPFEVSNQLNQRFSPHDMLTNPHCEFREIYNLQRTLTMGAGLNTPIRHRPPTTQELSDAAQKLIASAATLERTSYIVGNLIKADKAVLDSKVDDPKSVEVDKNGKVWAFDLTGTAITIGELDDTAIFDIRSRRGYFNAPKYYDNNPGCQAK